MKNIKLRINSPGSEDYAIDTDLKSLLSGQNNIDIIADIAKAWLRSQTIYDDVAKLIEAYQTNDASQILTSILEVYPDFIFATKKNGSIVPKFEAEEMVLFSKSLIGIYSPFLLAKPGETIYVMANFLSLDSDEIGNLPRELEYQYSQTDLITALKGNIISNLSSKSYIARTLLELIGLKNLILIEVTPAVGSIPAVYKFTMPPRIVTANDFKAVPLETN